jgi:hypothetical protein
MNASEVQQTMYKPDYGLIYRAIEVRSPAEARGYFPLHSVSTPALGPTQPPVERVAFFFGNKARQGCDADHSPHLVQKS